MQALQSLMSSTKNIKLSGGQIGGIVAGAAALTVTAIAIGVFVKIQRDRAKFDFDDLPTFNFVEVKRDSNTTELVKPLIDEERSRISNTLNTQKNDNREEDKLDEKPLGKAHIERIQNEALANVLKPLNEEQNQIPAKPQQQDHSNELKAAFNNNQEERELAHAELEKAGLESIQNEALENVLKPLNEEQNQIPAEPQQQDHSNKLRTAFNNNAEERELAQTELLEAAQDKALKEVFGKFPQIPAKLQNDGSTIQFADFNDGRKPRVLLPGKMGKTDCATFIGKIEIEDGVAKASGHTDTYQLALQAVARRLNEGLAIINEARRDKKEAYTEMFGQKYNGPKIKVKKDSVVKFFRSEQGGKVWPADSKPEGASYVGQIVIDSDLHVTAHGVERHFALGLRELATRMNTKLAAKNKG